MATGIRELKRVLASMRGRIDTVFTSAEKRKLLKDIANGTIKDAGALRAYVGRVEGVKRKKTKEQTATLSGKVVDAQSRKPMGGVEVRIQQTNFSEKTDGSGNFQWDGLVKGRTIRITTNLGGYKPAMVEYQAQMDNEQNVVIKIVPLALGAAAKRAKEGKK